MEKDLLIYLGLAFAIAVGCLIFWIKMKRLFRSSRKPKQSNNRHLLQKTPITDKGLFSFYKWRQTLRRWRDSESDFFVRACRSGDLERVKNYIQKGGDVNVRRHRGGRTGLMLAAEKNRLDVVALLLASGADVNLVGGGSGKNALIRAVEAGNLQISKMLVDHGSVLDVRSRISGKTALMKAAESGFLEILEYLIQNGADVHLMDRSGQTALLLALNPGNKKPLAIIDALIQAGANVNVADNAGNSPLDRAREFGLTDCEEALLTHGAMSARHKTTDYNNVNEQDKTAYEILGCRKSDSDERIRKQFLEMAKKYHPDSISGKDLPEDFVKFANQRFVELHNAFKTVMDSRKGNYSR